MSIFEGDLVAKCYFAKHKLVREILQNGLKSKMEIQWAYSTVLKATLPNDAPGTFIYYDAILHLCVTFCKYN